jgi:hypothetical protein
MAPAIGGVTEHMASTIRMAPPDYRHPEHISHWRSFGIAGRLRRIADARHTGIVVCRVYGTANAPEYYLCRPLQFQRR